VLGCFSFSPNKTITTGQGGMVVTDDDALEVRLRQLKDQGRPVRGTGGDDEHPTVGFNFKLSNLHAAVGLAQLDRIDARVQRMRDIYRQYAAGLGGVEGIRFPGFDLDAGEIPQWIDIVCDRRDELECHLAGLGMECRRFWHALHTTAPYGCPAEQFPVATAVVPRALWLPSAFTLSDADVQNVCQAIRTFSAAAAA
jgi:perosamine synthetase